MIANYCKGTAKVSPFITLHNAPGSAAVETIQVNGKAEARKIAANRNAKCWNF